MKKDLNRCGSCEAVYYCSRECQRADWLEHKKNCTGDKCKSMTKLLTFMEKSIRDQTMLPFTNVSLNKAVAMAVESCYLQITFSNVPSQVISNVILEKLKNAVQSMVIRLTFQFVGLYQPLTACVDGITIQVYMRKKDFLYDITSTEYAKDPEYCPDTCVVCLIATPLDKKIPPSTRYLDLSPTTVVSRTNHRQM